MAFQIDWRGASGATYRFETYAAGTRFNPVSGVYILCRHLGAGDWQALYVGETQSLEQRLNIGMAGHDGIARATRMGMTHVSVLPVYGAADRLRVEADLRHGLRPPANMQGATNALR